MEQFTVRARSVIHPGNYLLQRDDGLCFVYFSCVDELSATSIEPSLAEAMVQSYEWTRDGCGSKVTLDDLKAGSVAAVAGKGEPPDTVHAD